MTVSEQNIQEINKENRANLNQWDLHGVSPDDENEHPEDDFRFCPTTYCDGEMVKEVDEVGDEVWVCERCGYMESY